MHPFSDGPWQLPETQQHSPLIAIHISPSQTVWAGSGVPLSVEPNNTQIPLTFFHMYLRMFDIAKGLN